MAFTTATTPIALAGTLITIGKCAVVAEDNVSADSSGSLFQVRIDNSLNEDMTAYVKIADSANATSGSTTPDIVLAVPGGEIANYVWEIGFPYTAGLSVWCTALSNSSDVSALGETVSVTLLAST
tara:strand:+ start:323 stop:697 length:375 start_codon:yes stop_codon:yes gene_type:complete